VLFLGFDVFISTLEIFLPTLLIISFVFDIKVMFRPTPTFVDCVASDLGRFRYSFVKAPRQGDSEVTFSIFESNCHQLLPV